MPFSLPVGFVASTYGQPRSRRAARRSLPGPARYSVKAIKSGSYAATSSIMRARRAPPPWRMFQVRRVMLVQCVAIRQHRTTELSSVRPRKLSIVEELSEESLPDETWGLLAPFSVGPINGDGRHKRSTGLLSGGSRCCLRRFLSRLLHGFLCGGFRFRRSRLLLR